MTRGNQVSLSLKGRVCKQEQLVQLPLQFSCSVMQVEVSLLLPNRMWLYRKEAYPSFRSMKWIGMLLFTGGTEDLTIVFNSTSSDKVNRFPETRVTDSTWADLNNEPHHLISIKGCQLYQKRLYRQEPWRLFWRCRMARHSFHKLWLGGKIYGIKHIVQ